MNNNSSRYMNGIDELIERTPLDLVLSHYGLPLSNPGSTEYRMKCVFNEACSDSKYGNLAVKLDAAKRIYCHVCETKGNLLTLIHGLEKHAAPTGGMLRGQEFKDAAMKLRELNGIDQQSSSPQTNGNEGGEQRQPPEPQSQPVQPTATPSAKLTKPESTLLVNVPLVKHDKEAARALETLYQELVTNIEEMSPEAASYVRKRPWLTNEVMQKWNCGWIPGNGRSLFRKGYFVYTHRNVNGEVLSYSGRDLQFELKWARWLRDGKPEGSKPNKHRYVSGYHRGQELFGALASRLNEPVLLESLTNHGLVVVEGMNDVMRLDELGVCTVGLCSNRATDTQVELITKFASQVANKRVLLLPDCDEEGESGFKELLWQLAERKLAVSIGLSSTMFGRAYAGKQPEDLSMEDWQRLSASQ